MKKIWILSLLWICLLFTGCFNNRQDLPKNTIIFNETEIDWHWAIENDWKYYFAYSTIKPKWVIWDFNYAFWDCLWYVWDDSNDRIYELSGESSDEWLIKYYVNGEMETPTILRGITIKDEKYIPESVEWAPEEDTPEVISWNGEENILVLEDENMKTDSIINLKIWNAAFDVHLEENSATKALVEKLHEWDVIVKAHEYWWFEKVGNLGFDLPRTDKQITTEPGDLVLYQWNQISLFYNSNSRSYTKLWKVQMNSKEDLEKILWDWDVTLTFSLK